MVINILFTLILSWILFSISKEDIKTMLISEHKLRIFAILGIIYIVILGLLNKSINTIDLILDNIFAMLIIFLIMYSISRISYNLFKVNSLGIGDIKLSSISSIWLGIEITLISLCISFILSAIYSIYGKITKRFKSFHQYPFAPFLSIGIFCSWILDKI
jgi:leader peptidase (prepilin peptidase)/N-methyltransferase